MDIPRYLQCLAVLAIHVFLEESVDVAIFETHSGGQFDATNILESPLITAITSIGMDHVKTLGPTIRDIAWHKSGIFKTGGLALSSLQTQEISEVLQHRASEKNVELRFIGIDPALPPDAVALRPQTQKINCSLALAIVRAWLQCVPNAKGKIENSIIRGVDQFSWPGRYQEMHDKQNHWFLDGAHNELSLQYVADWFADAVQSVKCVIRIHPNIGHLPSLALSLLHAF